MIDQIKHDMLTGQFGFEEPFARVIGLVDENGVYYVNDGHHRINAALEIAWETGDRQCLEELIRHGDWRERVRSPSYHFPTRTVWSWVMSRLENR